MTASHRLARLLLPLVAAAVAGPRRRDGGPYKVANQLHRSAVLNGGESAVRPPFLVLRVTPLAPGVSGR